MLQKTEYLKGCELIVATTIQLLCLLVLAVILAVGDNSVHELFDMYLFSELVLGEFVAAGVNDVSSEELYRAQDLDNGDIFVNIITLVAIVVRLDLLELFGEVVIQ